MSYLSKTEGFLNKNPKGKNQDIKCMREGSNHDCKR